ncbi:helix-turn-helix transcriptional regulator [Dokdonella soli]|uniref:HTH araC/xylS-type domain-containing protein n=1 Tax=Dokdonella soli TaxID=529810 RepID=A0ABN1ITV6_9GAMM
MRIECEQLANGGRWDWNARERDEDALHVVLGRGRGCVLYGERLPALVMVPMRGRLQLSDGETSRSLTSGEALVVEPGLTLQAVGRGPALWIAVLLPAAGWQRLVADVIGEPLVAAGLLPAVHAADRSMRRAALRLVRAAETGDAGHALAAASVFALLVNDLQAELRPLIERCAGRTHAQRRNVFLRLQRVRNYMSTCCHLDLDVAHFARMASYSPCHFIRAFSAVYGETPHALLIEQRLRRARRLVNDSSMAITEVARASGFENRCAFSRSFKRRFGVSATDLRMGGPAAATAAA